MFLPPSSLLLLVLSLGIVMTAVLAYTSRRSPETRFALVISLLLVGTILILAIAPVMFFRPFMPA
jgi:hypothetical protein